ncbi:VOC family protein [Mycolicibacterium fallax]|uniref:Extradiol ring-cleavage dioxygenase n=1 Tax=Mycolicibacterium fallax TaxID=1793 RepID=A0A1X1RGU0_MYCFA|nr:VOC family protein [Mycolicibacterium fallax]ORV05566.1 extradiol ring-cleavage dioxygenase [Mycolicibacterium fallax]BBY96887.1 biphenyl-2,3-diol 1,2-dioxygenase [Mycolicibacterium fallax]
MPDIFGQVHLGYVVIETEKFGDWRRFGRDAIGMHCDDALPDVLRFRLDAQRCRFLLQRGPAEDVSALGWQVDDHGSFDEILARLTGHGVPLVEGGAEAAALRGVERFVRFPGHNGLAQEIFTCAHTDDAPTAMATGGGFVTGAAGLGHVAIVSKQPERLHDYYRTLFDARLSDFINDTIGGLKFKIRFLRVNERHHSVAIAAVNRLPINPIRTRVQHLNIQVADLDDLTESYRRVTELGFGMALDVGQHTNDRELSYYAVSPSGFEWEVGWNPLVVDEDVWQPSTHEGISIWGHTPAPRSIPELIDQLKTSARSLTRDEATVAV